VLITSITGCCSKLRWSWAAAISIRYQSKGAIAFDRFAAEHLRVSGFSEDKVFKAAENLLFGAVPDVGYQTRNPTKELRQHDRTVRLQSADLALRRTGWKIFRIVTRLPMSIN